MVKKGILGVLVGIWLLAPHPSGGAAWPWQWNRVDKQGNRTGKWRAYYNHKPDQLMYTGRFKKGKERGTWKTFSADGKLERLEKYEPKHKRIKTTFYHPNGTVSHRGMAYLFEEKNLLMYKWHGDWHYYDSTGQWRGWKSFSRGISGSPQPILTNRPPTKKGASRAW
ncbi:toxin-antitoxin system YwqK family antitoxin [Rufibacter psychrotolerans]|uniref:toxin-antitoxin system YwqK family antitoxin n=1 Tax=Rufibacter psychrotolerans TaxID=2812556 RepID=UPI001967FC8A|nr:hypothetical protein [Rufibacter sp. SYSU D00308]